MKIVRSGAVLAIVAALAITGTMVIKQQRRIRSLKESRHSLVAQDRELSATNTSLLSVDAARNDEIVRLREQTSEVLRLRSQLTQAQQQLAAAAENQAPRAENSNEFAGYVTTKDLKYVGFDSPENAFQSLNWARANGDYTNWLTSLAPQAQEEELANSNSFDEFQRYNSSSKIEGMQVLAAKPVGSDRVELKVRLDTENSVTVFIFPMVAVGNEWKLGDDIDTYTRAWDSPDGAP